MYEDEFLQTVEEGKTYNLNILYEYLIKHNYHLYSETIGVCFPLNNQRVCIVNKVINNKYNYVRWQGSSICYESVKGIIFAEIK